MGYGHVRVERRVLTLAPPGTNDDHLMTINLHFSNKTIDRDWLYEDEEIPAYEDEGIPPGLVQIREHWETHGSPIHLSLQQLSDSQSAQEIIKKELRNWLDLLEEYVGNDLVEKAIAEATHWAKASSVLSEEYDEVMDMYVEFTTEHDHIHELVDDAADEYEDDFSIRLVPSEEYDEVSDMDEEFTAEYDHTNQFGDEEFEDDYSIRMVPAIDSSIRSLKRKRMDDCERNESCLICLDEFSSSSSGCDEAVSMPCSHEFHVDCIEKWLRTSHYCPICRYEMPTKN